jgi:hypothetical protein
MTVSLPQLNLIQRNLAGVATRVRTEDGPVRRRLVVRRPLDGPKVAFPPRGSYRLRPAI